MSDKEYYTCIKCQKIYSLKVAEHNGYNCSSCGEELVEKGSLNERKNK